MTGEIKILYGEAIYTEDAGVTHIPTVAQIGVRDECEVLSVLLLPGRNFLNAQAQGIHVDMRDVMCEICLN